MIIITTGFLTDVVLSVARNLSTQVETVECSPASVNATGRAGVAVCSDTYKTNNGVRGHDEQPSYSMLIQAAYGLMAITILAVAYFVFRTVRFVDMLDISSLLDTRDYILAQYLLLVSVL